jgi:hypothetical protein
LSLRINPEPNRFSKSAPFAGPCQGPGIGVILCQQATGMALNCHAARNRVCWRLQGSLDKQNRTC